MTVYRDSVIEGNIVTEEIFHIMECTYSGTDMGERKVVATIKWATPIDFKIGDYIELQMQTLLTGIGLEGSVGYERFYIYTSPTVKKNSRPMSSGEAFEHTVTFYPRQYELGCVQMRDYVQQNANNDVIIYTGFDSVSFYGGARELMSRIMACLAESYHDEHGNPLWSYEITAAVDEDANTSLERFPFSFSGNSVMDALLKLNDKEGINTTFFINDRTIYVGRRRPYFCRVTDGLSIDTNLQTQIFNFQYGKTSHLPVSISQGGLFNITKTPGNESPITKLYAYGASRNLNRYYCSDRIKTGRYVNRLMLPSFEDDGRTDYVLSEEGIAKYGIREASKQFEEIYPSLRYVTYADLRKVKYCIKVKASGIDSEVGKDLSGHSISDSTYPVVRIQCYKVVESSGADSVKGVNMLVEAAPPEDLVVCIHATGKVIKTVLYGGINNAAAIAKQISADGKVPTTDGEEPASGYSNVHPGSCFAVHDHHFADGNGTTHNAQTRATWFMSPHDWSQLDSAETQESINIHQINYADTFWLTDLYVMGHDGNNTALYDNQTNFQRDGYSAWSWPRLNSKYERGGNDSTLVNEVVAVEPVTVVDTSWNVAEKTNQQYFDIYLRDVGFKIDEQNDFGEMVFVVGTTMKVSVLDGLLAGREFDVSGTLVDSQFSCVCAYNDDGSENEEFYTLPDSPRNSTGSQYAMPARSAGAIWRIRLLRLNNDDQNYANLDIILPMKGLEMKAGDHVVFLDIFMPDIYIHAAENRLLREAKKYLDANDKGSVSYAVEFDKVRIQQIAPYALQMREGLNVRMKDADLNVGTETHEKTLVDYTANPMVTTLQMFTDKEAAYTETSYSLFNIRVSDQITTMMEFVVGPGYRYLQNRDMYKVISDKRIDPENISSCIVENPGVGIKREYEVLDSTVAAFTLVDTVEDPDRRLAPGTYYYYDMRLTFADTDVLKRILKRSEKQPGDYVGIKLTLKSRVYDYSNPQTLIPGAEFYCKSDEVIDFKRGKFYEVTMDVENNGCAFDANDRSSAPEFCLSAVPASDGFRYTPEYTIRRIAAGRFYRFKFMFHLDDSFNEEYSYKPTVLFVQDGNTEECSVRLISVVQKDFDSDDQQVDYVDLKVDTVNIKITDNTRPDDRRIQKTYPQPIREIQATFKAESHASAWMALMQQVEDNAIEAVGATHIMETYVNMARRHYQDLLRLKTNIFDPDGTCDQTFLQVMMMQIGADSMNFRLEKTTVKQGVDELTRVPVIIPSNYTLQKVSDVWKFAILSDDMLYHYVYTEGSQGGTWKISNKINGTNSNEVSLLQTIPSGASEPVYPVYYICLKCPVDGDTGSWLVDTTQHPVNDESDANYWYFNWGILQPDNSGNYSIVETRGNAYMYGDNLICGRISSLSGGSYFDLNNGEMVLGDESGNGGALEYKNGRLTIRGVAKQIEDALGPFGKNYFPKKIMLDWNEANSGITAFGYRSGSYLAVNELLLYNNIGGRDNYDDVLLGSVEFESGQQYCLKVEWCLDREYDTHGLYLGFKYSDGTRSEWIKCESDTTTPTVDTLVSASGKTVTGICCTFGQTANTRIYNISLTKGTVAPGGWIIADDDYEVGGNNLYSGESQLRVPGAIGNNAALKQTGITLKSGRRYVITVERTVGTVSDNYLRVSEAYYSQGNLTYKLLGNFKATSETRQSMVVVGSGKKLVLKCSSNQSGDKYIDVEGLMVQEGTVATGYQGPYEHLSQAFERTASSSVTEINGGLISTSLLQLRNTNGDISAGMSGLDDHKKAISNGMFVANPNSHGVGVWAGATYAQALAAAAGGARIPVLLTKDGIGSMIGAFLVKEKNISVNVEGIGTIIIDTEKGISIYDNSKYLKTLISPDSVASVGTFIQGSQKAVISYPDTGTAKTGVSSSNVNYGYQDLGFDIEQEKIYQIATANTISSDGFAHLVFDTNVRLAGGALGDVIDPIPVSASLLIKKVGESNYVEVDTGAATNIGSTGDDEYVEARWHLGVDMALDEGEYNIYLRLRFEVDDFYDSTGQVAQNYDQGLSDLRLSLCLCDYDVHYQSDGDYGVYIKRDNAISNNYFGYKTTSYTVLGYDGLLSYRDDNRYFKVINTNNGQKIIAKGLPTSSSGLDDGELYIDGNFISLFQTLFSALNGSLDSINFSDGTKRQNLKNAINAFTSSITASSIIAAKAAE